MTLKLYLTQMAEMHRRFGKPPEGYVYASLYEYVLQAGHEIESRPLTREQHQYIKEVIRGGRYPLKQCFSNSQRVLLGAEDNRLAYYEGYAIAGILPVLHGWLVLDGQCVIDLTWRKPDAKGCFVRGGHVSRTRILGEIPPGYAYYGLEVATREEIRKQAVSTGMWQTFLDDWQNGYPRLRVRAPNGGNQTQESLSAGSTP